MKKSNPTHRLKLIILTIALGIAALLIARGITVITATAVYQLYTHHTQPTSTPTPAPPTIPNTIAITSNSDKWEICYLHTAPNGGESRHCPCVGTRLCLLHKPQPDPLTILWRNHHHDTYSSATVAPNQTHITLP
jgi:hypothetical protein